MKRKMFGLALGLFAALVLITAASAVVGPPPEPVCPAGQITVTPAVWVAPVSHIEHRHGWSGAWQDGPCHGGGWFCTERTVTVPGYWIPPVCQMPVATPLPTPTLIPTEEPTLEPTPTDIPTLEPTPTLEATATEEPTLEPTPIETSEPTPTSIPPVEPTATAEPTLAPTPEVVPYVPRCDPNRRIWIWDLQGPNGRWFHLRDLGYTPGAYDAPSVIQQCYYLGCDFHPVRVWGHYVSECDQDYIYWFILPRYAGGGRCAVP